MSHPLDLHLAERQTRYLFPATRGAPATGFHLLLLCACFAMPLVCVSCGAVGAPLPPIALVEAAVAVTPVSAEPYAGESVQFAAAVKNASNTAVTWQVNQTAGGSPAMGTIDSDGLYTSPASVPSPPTVTITAVMQADSTKSASSSVTILPLGSIPEIAVSPSISSVTTSQFLQLNVSPAIVTNSDVTWTVDGIANGSPTVGVISTVGVPVNSVVYAPPPTAGAHLITATLNVNTGTVGSAQVFVTDFTGTLTWRNDNSRSGVNSQELALGPATVSLAKFGKLFSCPIDGYAYAQPLYVANLSISGNEPRNVVFVATENDSVYAFDADANPCVQLWKTSLIPPGSEAIETPNLQITSTDIVPLVGITGTPVIGGSPPTLYVVAATQTVATNPIYSQQLYALNLTTVPPESQTTGVEIVSPAGQTSVFFPMLENQRAALLLANGNVDVAFGSYGGQGDYHGWLFGYDSVTLGQTGAFDVTPNAIQGGIWQSGGGPSADSNGNVFVTTGEGPFRPSQDGMDFSDSFLRLGTTSGLAVLDYFTPCEQGTLDTPGQDVGAGAAVLLPDSAGSSGQPHLLVGGSSNGSLYVVNRDDMGGYESSPCPDSSASVQTVPGSAGPILSTPLFWNNTVYVAPGTGNLMSFPMTAGVLASLASASQSPETLGPQGATPVLSWNGIMNADGTSNAIVWLIDSRGASASPNGPAILRAFDPNNLSNEIYNSAMAAASRDAAGLAVKFTVPTVANGKVYVGTQTELDVYGLLP